MKKTPGTRSRSIVAPASCPVTFTMGKIGGKWKPVILYLVKQRCNRFGMLQRAMQGVSKQMLTAQLRELEKDGILTRTIYPEIPPRVEYAISPLGRTLFPIIDAMREWGLKRMHQE